MGGIANIIIFACFGSIFGGFSRSNQNGKKPFYWFMIGIVIAGILLLVIAFISPWINGTVPILGMVSVLYLIITPLATTIIFNYYFRARKEVL